MAQTWKYVVGLGLLGGALATGCVVSSSSDGTPSSEAGSGGTFVGGGGGGKGGTGGSGGTTGGTSGKGGSGGTTGGTSSGGSAGSATGGTSGASGEAGAMDTGGTGTGGTAGLPTEEQTSPECDPPTGNLDNTPYPNCEPSDPTDPDPCEACIQQSCCDESIACYGFAPGNVCGWGGPDSGPYAGSGEIGCYVQCLGDYVDQNGLCDADGMAMCESACVTPMCGDVLGNQTSDLASCLHANCSDACFGIETCG